jgi:hypothetical protein
MNMFGVPKYTINIGLGIGLGLMILLVADHIPLHVQRLNYRKAPVHRPYHGSHYR